MKLSLSTAIHALVAAAPYVHGFIRTEELLSDGVVHVSFSNFTNADAVLATTTTTTTTSLVQPGEDRTIYKYAECTDAVTYWYYWYYGGLILVCGKGQRCSVAAGEALRISYSVSGEMDFPVLLKRSFLFRPGYQFANKVTTRLARNINWTGPSENRLWLKQWFAVTEASCRPCWSEDPPTGGWCGAWAKSKGWMPCADEGSCYEYSVSDAYGTCGAANHCQIGI